LESPLTFRAGLWKWCKQMTDTEVIVFQPHSRKKDFTVSSLIPRQTVNVLSERLGKKAGRKVNETLKAMKEVGLEQTQTTEH
jgi:hypothetical protein